MWRERSRRKRDHRLARWPGRGVPPRKGRPRHIRNALCFGRNVFEFDGFFRMMQAAPGAAPWLREPHQTEQEACTFTAFQGCR
jgi:hypothetical protein